MNNSLSPLVLAVGLAAFSSGYAQSVYTPEECKRMRPLMADRVAKAQDRFDKAKTVARVEVPDLIRQRNAAIADTKDQAALNAVYLGTITLNAVAQSVVEIMKLNPAQCAIAEGASVSAKIFLEGVTNEAVVRDVVLPTIAQGQEGRANADFETKEAAALALAGEAFGCAMPIGAAVTAGYNLAKNVAEVRKAAGEVSDNTGTLVGGIRNLEKQMRLHQERLLRTGRELQLATFVRKDLEATCAVQPTRAESTIDLLKLADMADKSDKMDKLELRSVLEGAERCMDMACVNTAMKAAGKLQNGFADRRAIVASLERTTARLDATRATQEAAERSAALQRQQAAAQVEAAQANQAAQAEQARALGALFGSIAVEIGRSRVNSAPVPSPSRPAQPSQSISGNSSSSPVGVPQGRTGMYCDRYGPPGSEGNRACAMRR